MKVKVKSGTSARVVRPSVSVIVNNGSIGATIHNGQPHATITGHDCGGTIFIPSGYIPAGYGEPTYHPPEIPGFVAKYINLSTRTEYYYSEGVWYQLAGGTVTTDTSYLYGSGDVICFGSGDTVAFGSDQVFGQIGIDFVIGESAIA